MNIKRIKKFYNDEESFNVLMNKIILKDYVRLPKLMNNEPIPNPWRVFFVILDVVQHDGVEVPPYDTLTKSTLSRTFRYMGWTFSSVFGATPLTSIYNQEDELVYRF